MAPDRGTDATMTIGTLARRTGMSVKTLRECEDLGLIYTVGRSPGNYRLFDAEALWCVAVITTLRGLGLTLAEIRDLAEAYLGRTEDPIGPRLAEVLRVARARTEDRVRDLHAILERIDTYEHDFRAQLEGRADFRDLDPRCSTAAGLTLPLGGGRTFTVRRDARRRSSDESSDDAGSSSGG